MESKKIVGGLLWRFAERCGAQLVYFVVSIVLARLLDPDVYGVVALVTVFTTVLQVFVDSGMGNALIQKKNADDVDFSTVFYFNIAVCCGLYIIMFMAAPLIAGFYKNDGLVPIIRVICLTIVISGIKNVQQAYVSRTMQFKKFFFSTLGGTLGAAVVGIAMAYMGFGVWALVAQQIFNVAVDTIILWITVKWRPKRIFSLERLKGLFSFGWKLLVSGLIDTIYTNIRQLIIGKIYSSSDLAYYNQGNLFPYAIVININTSIDSVLLPAMSNQQDVVEEVRAMTRRAIKISTYIMAPMMMGLAFVSEPFVRLVLTEKWMPCVIFLRIFCITYMFYPIHTSNLNAIKALGRSDLFLKLEIWKKIVGIVALVCTMWISVKAMAYSMLITSVLCQIINCWPNRKLLNYGYLEQLKDILPSILLAVCMGVCIYPVSLWNLPDIWTLVIQIMFGVMFYIVGSIICKIDSFRYLLNLIKSVFKRERIA